MITQMVGVWLGWRQHQIRHYHYNEKEQLIRREYNVAEISDTGEIGPSVLVNSTEYDAFGNIERQKTSLQDLGFSEDILFIYIESPEPMANIPLFERFLYD